MREIDQTPKKFLNVLQEHRGDYYLEYHCATPNLGFAILNLIFPKNAADLNFVRASMERELDAWLRRYPVPIMAHGIDEKEDRIRFPGDSNASTLMGQIDETGSITRRWGLFKDHEMPAHQAEEAYLEGIYRDVPFRWAKDVREKAQRETRSLVRTGKILMFFMVVVPVLIEIVALGVGWLGHLLAALSIGFGLLKVAKVSGYKKPSPADEAKQAEELRRDHYHYHCERNPDGFARLLRENTERDAIERTRLEEAKLREQNAN